MSEDKTPTEPPYVDESNRYLTESLFKETNTGKTPYGPRFVLAERDRHGLPSMRRLYLEMEDPTEYSFATEVLGSYDHWKKLSSLKWFRSHLLDWRKELELRIRAKAIRSVASHAENKPDAAKWLAECGWKEKRRGRPTKQEKDKQELLEKELSSFVKDDYDRLGLKIN